MLNVNFEIVSINTEKGAAYVKFWADGATQERFGADIGPYEILMLPECKDMTEEEFHDHIAKWGLSVVTRQTEVLQADNEGVFAKYETLLNVTKKIPLVLEVLEDQD